MRLVFLQDSAQLFFLNTAGVRPVANVCMGPALFFGVSLFVSMNRGGGGRWGGVGRFGV